MKLFISLLLTITMLAACKQAKKDKRGNDTRLPVTVNITAESLVGHWIVLEVSISGTNPKYNALLESVVAPMRDFVELGIFNFQTGGKLLIDDGKKDYENGKWTFAGNRLTIRTKTLSSDRDLLFTVTHFIKDSATIENIMDQKDDTLHIQYRLQKLHAPDSAANIFDPAMNTWRDKPAKPESNAELKARLKKLLAYYSAYFDMFRRNKVPMFNREKILCPLAFYSGGLGLAPFDDSDHWKEIFYNTADAKKAYKMLEKLFDSFKDYPNEGKNYVLEYVIALDRMSKQL